MKAKITKAKAKAKTKTKIKSSGKNYNLMITLMVIALLLSALFMGIGYYLGFEKGKVKAYSSFEQEKRVAKRSIDKLQYIVDKKNAKCSEINREVKNVLQEVAHNSVPTASHEYATANNQNIEPPKAQKRAVVKSVNRPKLAIIIDDVSFARDVRAIKSLNVPLTMSFLPPSSIHPDSAALAKKEKIYMVHLPLEATNFNAAEVNTLHVGDSQKKISDKIRSIKKDFPRVKYINNHTGSKFTANEMAMNKLIFAMKKNNIRFIDSRTTAKTTAPQVLKNYGYSYIARDVFLDHISNISEIKKELKRAVALAKRHGSAIAIGHPHKKTLQAIRESSSLLKEVELVYINELI